jgi:WD40 repeat protein
MSPRAREETVWRRDLIFLVSLITGLYLLAVNPVNAKRETAWVTYKLPVHDVPWGVSVQGLEGKPWESASVRACAFTPDSRRVAFLYLTEHQLSETPWKVVYTSHLALWDFTTGKVEEKLNWDYTSNSQGDRWPSDRRYLSYTEDGLRLVLLGSNAVHIFDTANYRQLKRIAFDPPEEKFPDDGWATVGFSLAVDGSRAAVAISSTIGGNGGFVRVYDLKTGQIIREWRLHDGVRYVTGVALSSDGERVAASWLPVGRSSDPETFIPAGTDNVRVMDVKTGETVAGVNTNYVAGPVLFGPKDTLLTGSINNDRKGYALDTVKVWDARTGKLLREITNPRTGVHYRLDFSPDGKLLLGYTGTEKPVENFVNIDRQQFTIWDFASGKLLATSPEVLPVKNVTLPPLVQLSPDGKFVLVSWGNASIPPNAPVVYEIPQH